jgi:hypothetical protein
VEDLAHSVGERLERVEGRLTGIEGLLQRLV